MLANFWYCVIGITGKVLLTLAIPCVCTPLCNVLICSNKDSKDFKTHIKTETKSLARQHFSFFFLQPQLFQKLFLFTSIEHVTCESDSDGRIIVQHNLGHVWPNFTFTKAINGIIKLYDSVSGNVWKLGNNLLPPKSELTIKQSNLSDHMGCLSDKSHRNVLKLHPYAVKVEQSWIQKQRWQRSLFKDRQWSVVLESCVLSFYLSIPAPLNIVCSI